MTSDVLFGTALRAAALAAAVLAPCAAARSEPLAAAYRVEASVHPEEGLIEGAVVVTVENRTERALPDLLVCLYPNAFLEPSPRLNDINHEWVYPSSFAPGSMEVLSIRAEEGPSRPGEASFVRRPPAAGRCFLSVPLRPPLPAGGTAAFRLSFRTRVPRKFGPFGVYDDLLTADGGWHPFLPAHDAREGWLPSAPAPFAPHEASVRVPAGWRAVLNGRLFGPGETARLPRTRTNLLTLSAAEAFFPYETELHGVRVTYVRADEDEGFAEKVLETARSVLAFARRRFDRPLPSRLALVEARARFNLSYHGGGGSSLVSDRLLRVLPYPVDLRAYHLREVAFELFYLLLLPSVARAEDVRDYNWTAEGLAWLALRRYLDEGGIAYDEVVGLLRLFSFIPVVDQTLVAPRFPFNDVFFDTFFKSEPHREHVLRFANRTPFGRIVVEKLRDALPGGPGRRALEAHVSSPRGRSLRAVLEGLCPEGVGWFWKQWRQGYPRVNYRVGAVETERLGPGRHRVSVEILRSGPEGFAEWVDVGVRLEDGRRFRGRVLVTGPRTVDRFVYPGRPDSVVLDPRGRLRETNRTDNKEPRSLKILVTNFYPRLDISPDFSDLASTHLNLDVRGGFAAIAEGDYANQVFLNYFYESRGFGFNLGYMRALGFKVDRTDFPQGVGAFVFFERLDPGFARAHEEEEEEDGDGHRLVVTSLRLFYTLDTRIDHTNPHDGFAATVTAELADKILGTDFRFASLTANVRWIFAPLRHHVFALQGKAGLSWGGMPRQRLFALGGYGGLRGMPEHESLGAQQLLFRLEYRHLLLNELDINFFWIGYIRRLGGSLFVEVGAVADRFDGLFRLDRYRASLGYGIKISFDSFGVRPFLVGMDVGFRLDEARPTPEIYLTIGQAF